MNKVAMVTFVAALSAVPQAHSTMPSFPFQPAPQQTDSLRLDYDIQAKKKILHIIPSSGKGTCHVTLYRYGNIGRLEGKIDSKQGSLFTLASIKGDGIDLDLIVQEEFLFAGDGIIPVRYTETDSDDSLRIDFRDGFAYTDRDTMDARGCHGPMSGTAAFLVGEEDTASLTIIKPGIEGMLHRADVATIRKTSEDDGTRYEYQILGDGEVFKNVHGPVAMNIKWVDGHPVPTQIFVRSYKGAKVWLTLRETPDETLGNNQR
ncbi:MAG: hypothetical protein V1735_00105 [Nanoarchaeota archaeon]